MKKLNSFLFTFIVVFSAFCQDDGGMLCGGEDEIPIWILKWSIIDRETHYPISFANVEIFKNRGDGLKWNSDNNGIAVLVVTSPNCLPFEGTLEITAKNHKYYSQTIDRDYFDDRENEKRIFLDGHPHNWTDFNQIPSTQELIDKIRDNRYKVGVSSFMDQYGINWPNYAPACFEYEILMERIYNDYDQRINDDYYDIDDNDYSDDNNHTPTIFYDGETIYVFPNDLSGGSYHWEQANTACRRINRLGFDDWRLPTKEELNILYLNKDLIGNFTYGWYWSSTESYGDRIWVQGFKYGDQADEYWGTTFDAHKGSIKVRCIRTD